MRSLVFPCFPGGNIGAGVGTVYFPLNTDASNSGGAATENLAYSVMPATVTFRKLRAVVTGAGFSAGESATITLRTSDDDGSNWSDTGLSVTVSDSVTGDNEDGVDVTLARGDRACWKVVRAGGNVGNDQTTWTCEMDCADGQPIFGSQRTQRIANDDPAPNGWGDTSGSTYFFYFGCDGTLKNLTVATDVAAGAGESWSGTVQVADGSFADTSFASAGFDAPMGATDLEGEDTSTTLALERGDKFYCKFIRSTASVAASCKAWSCIFAPDTDGLSTYSYRASINDTLAQYGPAGLGGNTSIIRTNETQVQNPVPSADWTVRDAFFHVQNDTSTPGTGNERGIDFRVDAASTGPSLLLGATDVLDEDLVNTVALDAGDLIDWLWTIGGSAACDNLGNVRVGFVLEDTAVAAADASPPWSALRRPAFFVHLRR